MRLRPGRLRVAGEPGPRGFAGPGRGAAGHLEAAPEWRATTVQACGLWPFAVGTGTPMTGVPLGRDLLSGATLCCDPVSWFQRARLISTPSAFVLGRPGLGKSTVVRRMALGLAGYGVLPLVLGDLKPDYVDLMDALGGQVVSLGDGRGRLNVLDPGETAAAARRLTGDARARLLADAHGRRQATLSGLVTVLRGGAPPTDREETVLDRATRLLDDRSGGTPATVHDLLQVVRDGPAELRAVVVDRGERRRYDELTEALEASLLGLVDGGRLGRVFGGPTTVPIRRDRPVVVDVSSVDDARTDLQAALLLATWSQGFGAVAVSHALADAGLEPRRHHVVVLDELWRVLRAGRGMVDRVDALTRLNRQRGVGLVMVSHTMGDLLALPDAADRAKARGFVERAGMVLCGGLPAAELPMLTSVVPMTQAEQELLVGWQDPPAWDPGPGRPATPPGQGNFLVKVGGRPGIPFHVTLTAAERDLHDTDRRWHEVSRAPAPA